MEYIKCINKRSYKTTDHIYKKTNNNIVLDIIKNNKYYVCKILFGEKNGDKLELKNMKTEISALKFLEKLKLPFFPIYEEDFVCKNMHLVIMEKLNGKLLIDFKHKKMSKKFWKNLIFQLVLTIYILEDNKILHNDFWDENLIIVPIIKTLNIQYNNINYKIKDFIVKVIDYQYTNQYSNNPHITSELVMSKNKSYQKEKKRLGWSEMFHTGGDLNQIFGILSEYKYIPSSLKKYFEKNVITNKEADFPYAIQEQNDKTTAKYLMNNIDLLFKN